MDSLIKEIIAKRINHYEYKSKMETITHDECAALRELYDLRREVNELKSTGKYYYDDETY